MFSDISTSINQLGPKRIRGRQKDSCGCALACVSVCVGLCVCISMYEVLPLQSCDCQTIHFMSLNESLMMIKLKPKDKNNRHLSQFIQCSTSKVLMPSHTHAHTKPTHTRRNICTAPSSSSWWWCGVKSLFSVTVADSLPAVKMTVVNDQMH